jgi:hypothetical protein
MKVQKDISNEKSRVGVLRAKKKNVNTPLFSGAATTYCIVFMAILFLGSTFNDKAAHIRGQKGYTKVDKHFIPPTLMPGGGRDWTLNLEEGTISPKHDDTFALGAQPNASLVLTNKGEPNQITFSPDNLKTLQNGESVSMTGIGLQYPYSKLKESGEWYYAEACAAENKSIEMRYLDGNFLAMKDQDRHDLVLDVSFWNMKKGTTVNFVMAGERSEWRWYKPETWFKPKTFIYGGGRDWILNLDDGTISPKHTPHLVLGQGPIRLILAEKNSPATIKFDNLVDLASGKSTTLTYDNKQKAIGKVTKEEQYAGAWRYIESEIVEPAIGATHFTYLENNYIGTTEEDIRSEKALVLDIAFWQMIDGNAVNLVGGWVWKDEKEEKE